MRGYPRWGIFTQGNKKGGNTGDRRVSQVEGNRGNKPSKERIFFAWAVTRVSTTELYLLYLRKNLH
jgi:hypothetical protein